MENQNTSPAHTAGPWFYKLYGGYIIEGADGPSVCTMSSNTLRTSEEQEANARLIAAAPKMLEALLCVSAHFDGDAEQLKEKVLPQLRSAISFATVA
jgi:hypothetical protein